MKKSYSAKQAYQHDKAGKEYEFRNYYQGFIGMVRRYRERNGINKILFLCFDNSVVLDCPCGNGRWLNLLSTKANYLFGRDISKSMVKHALSRDIDNSNLMVDIRVGDAENLDLENFSVDIVFSYALMKHLPVSTQYKVMKEFSRVSKKQIACSFAVINKFTKLIWKARNIKESYPVTWKQLEDIAKVNNLKIIKSYKTTMPFVGLEYLVLFDRL